MIKKDSYIEYVRTALITMTVIIVISTFMLFVARYNAMNKLSEEDLAIQNDMFGYLILKYQHDEESDPNNAVINLKLAQLYELLGSYQQAEEEYILALEKRNGRYEAASYGLAGVLLLEKKYSQAEAIINEQRATYRYSSVLAKGNFYKSFGDSLFNDGDYFGALNNYNKSIALLKKIKSSVMEEVQNSRCETFIAIADDFVAKSNPKEAIKYLEQDKKTCKNPLLSYKLGILSMANEPEKAVKLFEKTLKEEPSIVNFKIYKALLADVKDKYSAKGDNQKSKLYDAKLARLESYAQRNVLDMKELDFKHFDLNIKKFPIRNEYDLIYSFDIKNVTNEDIPNLYAIVDFYDKNNNKIYSAKQNIAPLAGGFKAASDGENIKVTIRTKKNLIQRYDKINLKFYLAKNPAIYKQLYATNQLDVIKGKKLQVELF